MSTDTDPNKPGAEADSSLRRMDRIAEPRGTRTPYAPGEDWSVRVDQFLEEGVSEDKVDCWAQTASLHHSDGDGLDLAIKDGRIVGVRGRAIDRVSRGRVDPKDLFVWQAYNRPERLKRPLVRENGRLKRPTGTARRTGSSNARRACLRSRVRPRWASTPRATYSRGLLRPGDDRQGRHRHQPSRREHLPVHGHGRQIP
jgi:hypothetical protein